jgi:nitrite reductase/ring-hydroxylating ferredoxin subunit
MTKCETCGNEYDKAFTVTLGGETHTFDSFEWAIHRLAPQCAHCECRILGHGVEAGDQIYCCAHCASHAGETGPRDRAP